jgi:hypothetical protein
VVDQRPGSILISDLKASAKHRFAHLFRSFLDGHTDSEHQRINCPDTKNTLVVEIDVFEHIGMFFP